MSVVRSRLGVLALSVTVVAGLLSQPASATTPKPSPHPSAAAAQAAKVTQQAPAPCPVDIPSYTGNCGPRFVLPGWGDAGGWNDPSKYSTIKLVDINGDGKSELIGRNDDGLEIWEFDTTLGQWRPAVDSKGVPQVLNDFRSSLPSGAGPFNTDWTQAQYYSTIKTADITGDKTAEVVARFADGIHTYQYTPPAGTHDINGGTWKRLGNAGPFSDGSGWTDPSYYLTIQLGDVDGAGRSQLLSRSPTGIAIYAWNGNGWSLDGAQLPYYGGNSCASPDCYLDLLTAPTSPLTGSKVAGIVTRAPNGIHTWYRIRGTWTEVDSADDPGPFSSSTIGQLGFDCPFDVPGPGGMDCFNQSPSYYETLQHADVDGQPGDELFGRATDGLRMKKFEGPRDITSVVDDTDPSVNYTYGGAWGWVHTSGDPQAIKTTQSTCHVLVCAVRFQFTGTSVTWIGRSVSPTYALAMVDNGTRQYFHVAGSPQYQRKLFTASGLTDGPHTLELATVLPNATLNVDAFSVVEPSQLGTWKQQLPTLSALAGSGSDAMAKPGSFGSIRTAKNLDGSGQEQVLAVDGTALQAWSYNPASNDWNHLNPKTPLQLGAMWLTHPEYYNTIQTGDVDGDGRADVIARGPFGIRTWFYNRRGSGGWERYSPDGYPDFPYGEQVAYITLGQIAIAHGVIPRALPSIRAFWTGRNAPKPADLAALQQGLLSLANCTGAQPGTPVHYQSCTAPPDGTGFTDADWTAVINEMITEIYSAQQVVSHFSQLNTMRQSLFIASGSQLPSIGTDLQLSQAAGKTASFSPGVAFATVLHIAGATAGAEGGPAGAALSVASDLAAMLPSASPTLSSTFSTDYTGLQAQFTNSVSDVAEGLDSLSQQVRLDKDLLILLGQLRSRATWAPDTVGLTSAANEGFALWIYQTLLPTLYVRFAVTNCKTVLDVVECDGVGPGNGIVGGPVNFTALSTPPTAGSPCFPNPRTGFNTCHYTSLPTQLANAVWGPVSSQCAYQSGRANTGWTFGCSLGADVATSVGANSGHWSFQTFSGDPYIGPGPLNRGIVHGIGNGASSGAGSIRLRGIRTVPADLDLSHATVTQTEMLYEPGRRRELALTSNGKSPPPLTLTRHGGISATAGTFTTAAGTPPHVRLRLSKLPGSKTQASYDLTITDVTVPVAPAGCANLPHSVSIDDRATLRTQFIINDGRHRPVTITLQPEWQCSRNANGSPTSMTTGP